MNLTSATGTISSAGIGSGLDVNSIVTQLVAVERQPLQRLQSVATNLQTQLSAFGQLQSLVSALQDAARPLYKPESFALTNAGSSDPTSVSAGTTSKAVPGIYSVAVSSLAAPQSVVSATGQFSDGTAAVGTGSLTIRLGAWNADQSVFTPKTGSSDITIPVGASENTLAGIRDKINAADAGVSATLVNDATGTRLALQSRSTGADSGFRVTVVEDAPAGGGSGGGGGPVIPLGGSGSGSGSGSTNPPGLSRLAYDPASGATSQLALAQAAANTQATINGIALSSTSNTLDGAIDGITFTVSKVTTQPVTVNVTRNTEAIKTFVSSFVTSYNALNTFLSSATRYDPATKQAALLQGDGTTTGIQNQLHTLVSQQSGASTALPSLSSIGVQVQKDGSLKLDDTAFADAVGKLPELTKALSNVDDVVAANNGFGKRFAAWADKLLASNGSLPGKTTALQARITANKKSQDAMSDRLVMIEKRLRAQYTTLDTTMSKANALSKYVQQQFYYQKNNNN